MFDEKTFQLMQSTLIGKVKNIDMIPCCSKESLIEALNSAASINDLIGINKAILRLISKA
ncbi:hypothetical protein [Vibrio methylphosphonaticus]|uniref:hypothetical protein n=1 Tax=Vibrio methylphosphonaticus TaxID=2946866 RepID=UPI002029C84D|nr:hypothetical protein [Vibrio methylphosphonaticus]MCL9773671.1 hypothetical protein [Vibrio methylphosphonaticus]